MVGSMLIFSVVVVVLFLCVSSLMFWCSVSMYVFVCGMNSCVLWVGCVLCWLCLNSFMLRIVFSLVIVFDMVGCVIDRFLVVFCMLFSCVIVRKYCRCWNLIWLLVIWLFIMGGYVNDDELLFCIIFWKGLSVWNDVICSVVVCEIWLVFRFVLWLVGLYCVFVWVVWMMIWYVVLWFCWWVVVVFVWVLWWLCWLVFFVGMLLFCLGCWSGCWESCWVCVYGNSGELGYLVVSWNCVWCVCEFGCWVIVWLCLFGWVLVDILCIWFV